MKEVIVNGLLIKTKRRFIQFKRGSHIRVINDRSCDLLTIEYPPGLKSAQLIDPMVELVEDVILQDTELIKIKQVPITINGVTLQKLLPYEYQFNQYVVDGIQDFIIDYDHQQCTILIPQLSITDFNAYINTLKLCPYLKILNWTPERLSSIHSVMIHDQGGTISSNMRMVFKPKETYEQYLLKDIDVINSFISQLSSILNSYGVQLVRYPIDQDTKRTNRVIYKITEIGKLLSHKSGYEIDSDSVLHKSTIEFECSFPDLILLNDFRSKYSNIDLISNFTTFYTTDKANRPWLSSVEWSPIDSSYNSEYNQDSQGNTANSSVFSCDIEYYVVYARLYNHINEIITKLVTKGCKAHSDKEAQLLSWMEVRNKIN